MHVTWHDLAARGVTSELYGIIPKLSCLSDELNEAIDEEDIQAGYSDNRFDYEYHGRKGVGGGFDLECDGGSGEVTVEFDDIEGLDKEIVFNVSIEIPEPITRSEARRITAHGECDYPTETVSVECKAILIESSVEERVVQFRNEPLTYFHYKAKYSWETTGEIEA